MSGSHWYRYQNHIAEPLWFAALSARRYCTFYIEDTVAVQSPVLLPDISTATTFLKAGDRTGSHLPIKRSQYQLLFYFFWSMLFDNWADRALSYHYAAHQIFCLRRRLFFPVGTFHKQYLFIYILPVASSNYFNDQYFIINVIDDPEITFANTVTFTALEFFASNRTGDWMQVP